MPRTTLVTGGAGFIGSHLVEALVARGDRVRVLDNFCAGKRENLAPWSGKIELIEADLNDAEPLRRAVQGVDTIFHEAALASVPLSVERPLDTHAACVTGTVALLQAAKQAGVRRVVYAGSSSAYGDQPTASKRESDLPAPISPYGAAKLAAELYCQAFAALGAVETVTVRYFNVFGPRQDPFSQYSAVIPLFITAMIAGKSPVIFGDGRQSRDFTYVQDIVQGNLLAADAPGVSGRAFNIAGGGSIDLLELVRVINQLLGLNIRPQHEPARAGDVRTSQADITLARTHLKYEPQVSFEEGLRKSIEYYVAAAKK
jgi:UDP-glucose 4-epimerase